MRDQKIVEIQIDEKTTVKVTVKELTVKEILDLGNKIISNERPETVTLDNVKNALNANLSLVIEGMDVSELVELAPSDLEKLFDAFKEVNKSFLAIAEEVGLMNLLTNMKETLKQDYLKSLADLSSQVIKTA